MIETLLERLKARLDELEESKVHCWLKLLVLMMATSYTVNESGRIFKSEYIVSQSIMLTCAYLTPYSDKLKEFLLNK